MIAILPRLASPPRRSAIMTAADLLTQKDLSPLARSRPAW